MEQLAGIFITLLFFYVLYIREKNIRLKNELNYNFYNKLNNFIVENPHYSRGGYCHNKKQFPKYLIFTVYRDGDKILSTTDDEEPDDPSSDMRNHQKVINHLNNMSKLGDVIKYRVIEVSSISADSNILDPFR